MELHAASVAIQQQKLEYFWEIHDYMFENLAKEPPVLISPEDLYDYARDVLGLDMELYDEVYLDPNVMSYILWDKQQGENLDVIGTPGIFICGKPINRGWSEIEEAIDEFLY
jgi:protein-disulfide isomerase